ncbi:T9SS type A sorting domain-containing protein [candidate division KSB1 bacterium]|nr:T9SS type A sorting domain-containing protein [candidate division KSB1 bacterium]
MPLSGSDAFIARFDAGLTRLEACTLLGSSAWEEANNVVIGLDGWIYVAGNVSDRYSDDPLDFPITEHAFDKSVSGSEIFVAKFHPDLSFIVYSTFIGGSDDDSLATMIYDDLNGDIILSGCTWGGQPPQPGEGFEFFPTTPGAYDETPNMGASWYSDLFICRLDSTLSLLQASTFFGGTSYEGEGVSTITATGDIVLAGETMSQDFPVSPASWMSELPGSRDICISVLTSDLSDFKYSTLFGGTNRDDVIRVVLDNAGNIYICGETYSDDFPITPGAHQTKFRNFQNYVSQFNPDLTELLASTFVGPENPGSCDSGWLNKAGMCIDGENYIYAGFKLCWPHNVSDDAFDFVYEGETEIYIEKLSADLSTCLASTYIGGASIEFLHAMDFGPHSHLLLAGTTFSHDFPTTPSAYDTSFDGPAGRWYFTPPDGFILAIDKNLSAGVVPVELALFEVSCINGSVELFWITQSETENLGFNVYRSPEPRDNFIKMNDQLIAGLGNSSVEKVYHYRDEEVEPDQQYYYKIECVSSDGRSKQYGPVQISVSGIPQKYVLYQNYPNPFNNQTTVTFDLVEDTQVKLKIYSMTGKVIRSLIDSFHSAGRHSVVWNGRSDNGLAQPSGTYICKMVAGDVELSKMLVLVR